jgi:hypothetical protein
MTAKKSCGHAPLQKTTISRRFAESNGRARGLKKLESRDAFRQKCRAKPGLIIFKWPGRNKRCRHAGVMIRAELAGSLAQKLPNGVAAD